MTYFPKQIRTWTKNFTQHCFARDLQQDAFAKLVWSFTWKEAEEGS